MTANLTTRELLAEGLHRLAGVCDTPHLDAELLLAHGLRTQRARLIAHPEAVPGAGEASLYQQLLERRAAGEPLAYLVGYREFWSLQLAVTPAVLVPRPETELLVERALALRTITTARVADLGTGSGAIALALASERPAWQLTATDVSADALAVARANAAAHGLERIELVLGNWLEPLAGRQFHLLVSNPPYVAPDDPALSESGLRFEPRLALAAADAGLASLRAIVRTAPAHLERGGWLLLEHGATQAADVARELVVRGFRHIRSQRDLAGLERMTEAEWGE